MNHLNISVGTHEIGRRWGRQQLSCGLWREGVPWGLFEAKWFVNGTDQNISVGRVTTPSNTVCLQQDANKLYLFESSSTNLMASIEVIGKPGFLNAIRANICVYDSPCELIFRLRDRSICVWKVNPHFEFPDGLRLHLNKKNNCRASRVKINAHRQVDLAWVPRERFFPPEFDPFKMIGFVPQIEFPTEFFAGGGLSTDYLFEDASEFDWLPKSNSLTSTLVVVALWARMALY